MSQQHISRRQFGALALTGIGTTFLLAGCGTSATPPGSSTSTAAAGDAFKKATLNFTWWTNPVRTAYTNKIVQNYTEAHTRIIVNQAPGEWATYWTKLSTQVAGQTEPDIIQMDQLYIAEYGGRGALMDMSKVSTIDLRPLKPFLGAGTYNGKLFGVPAGTTALAMCANKTLFQKAGVKLPDDKTWTWKDYFDICENLARESNGAFLGGGWGNDDTALQIWLHQHGEQLYTGKGKLGFTEKNVASWLSQAKKVYSSDFAPTPDDVVNDATASVQQSMFGTGKIALSTMWNTQVTAYQQANGDDLVLLRLPSVAGTATKNGVYFKPSMFWSIGSQTKYPAQAGALINYFLTNTSAAKLQLAERGVPQVPAVIKVVKPLLSPTDQLAVDYMQNVQDEVKWVPPVPPMGASQAAAICQRHTQDVIFNRASPAAAAAALKSELQSALSAAAPSTGH